MQKYQLKITQILLEKNNMNENKFEFNMKLKKIHENLIYQIVKSLLRK